MLLGMLRGPRCTRPDATRTCCPNAEPCKVNGHVNIEQLMAVPISGEIFLRMDGAIFFLRFLRGSFLVDATIAGANLQRPRLSIAVRIRLHCIKY